jgi:hypothetical protein
MADRQHLLMIQRGSNKWNTWRMANPKFKPDLTRVDFTNAANLNKLTERNQDYLFVIGRTMDLSGMNLTSTDLSGADLRGVDFSNADLKQADFTDSKMGYTTLANVDLSQVKGLETIEHDGPSSIGIDTIYRSQGNVSETFLRGAGVPENIIIFMHSLTKTAFEFYSCFISYSAKDHEFVERLHADLQSKGVRCWFAPEDLKIGAELRSSFDEAISLHERLMVVLSRNSIQSHWVEKEVETAFENERKQNRTVLFPIRLDDNVMETDQAWAADIRRTRHIGDFRNWKNRSSYKKALDRLLRDLKAKGNAESAQSSNK